MHSIDECKAIIDAFIETPFTNDERHIRRIKKIAKYEEGDDDSLILFI